MVLKTRSTAAGFTRVEVLVATGVMSIVRRAVKPDASAIRADSVSDALIQASGLVGRDAKPRRSDRSLMARSFRSR